MNLMLKKLLGALPEPPTALDILAHVRQDASRRLGPRPDSRRAAAVAAAETICRLWQAAKRPA